MILEPEEFLKRSKEIGAPTHLFIESADKLLKDKVSFPMAKVQNRKVFFTINQNEEVDITGEREDFAKCDPTTEYIEVFTLIKHIAHYKIPERDIPLWYLKALIRFQRNRLHHEIHLETVLNSMSLQTLNV